MREVFADTGFYVALLNPQDNLHAKAKSLAKAESGSVIVTCEFVLVEVLNFFGPYGSDCRRMAAAFCAAMHGRTQTRLLAVTSDLYGRARDRYAQRLDKEWSLVDCASFLCMEEGGLSEALAHDRHFEEAGFVALMR